MRGSAILSLVLVLTCTMVPDLSAAEPKAVTLPETVTFAEHIAPLVFENCTGCHRPTQVAPFHLMNFADTKKHAKTMLRTMQDRFMPPWQPEAGIGEFRNERRLTETQIALFEKWVKSGMAEGDAKKTPALPAFPEGWRLGKPDLIVKMDRPFDVPASGPDIYQNFVLPLNNKDKKWVTAVEFIASAPTVIHHVLYHTDDQGRARKLAPAEGQPGFPGMGFRRTGTLGGWAVGATPVKLPDGLAYPLNPNSDLVLQTHFHLSGKAEKETITVGIYFADEAPTRTLMGVQLPPVFGLFSNLQIPPGKKDYTITESFKLPVDVDVIGAGAHAHYLGKTLKMDAKLPDGTTKKLFSIKDWDFNWQGQYLYKEPIRLPKGTLLTGTVTWDNSADNPRNPSSPPVAIKWGEGSTDEMGSVSLMLVPAQESDKNILRDELQQFSGRALIRAYVRGDKIPWKEFGIDPQDVMKRFGNRPKNPK